VRAAPLPLLSADGADGVQDRDQNRADLVGFGARDRKSQVTMTTYDALDR
jgi:hypothetical protein